MDIILCHQTADFDALGAAVGLTKIIIGAKIVLSGGAHPGVKEFLALHRDELAIIELKSVNPKKIKSLTIVDCLMSDRLGKAAEWLTLENVKTIKVYDHHLNQNSDIPTTEIVVEEVGATTTLIVEQLQKLNLKLTVSEATVMALGIHVDTGSLTFPQSTSRDAYALGWLMMEGASIKTIADYVEPSLSPKLQELLKEALFKVQKQTIQGYSIGFVILKTTNFVPGLSGLTEKLIDLTETEVFLLFHEYQKAKESVSIIGRSKLKAVNLNELFKPLGGGGHNSAASVSITGVKAELLVNQLIEELKNIIPQRPKARDLMSSPVRTIRPETTIEQAQRILLRYGHSGLCVANASGELVGVISRRDLDLALHHGFNHAPVKGYMSKNLKTVTPDTGLAEIESLMVTYDLGRLPVLESNNLIGIVTRTDILRQIHQDRNFGAEKNEQDSVSISCLLPQIKERLSPSLWKLLTIASNAAQEKGWHLYLVGGAVRDLLLGEQEKIILQDLDLVVDGFNKSADTGAGVELANVLEKLYPQARLSVHGEFQTAALLWQKDPEFGSLTVDIATARTEFYAYPAANPQVSSSSIRQDLYRRDFTVNALAIRLTSPREGELLDFFGGLLDLRSRKIRVLHANSFIEDPTRIYRGVRFAAKLKFIIETQTAEYINYAIDSGVYERLKQENHPAPALTTRLKAELKYILQSHYWKEALVLLRQFKALRCVHPDLVLNDKLWWQLRYISRLFKYIAIQVNIEPWLIKLETIIAYLPSKEAHKVAGNLELPKDSIVRLTELAELDIKIDEKIFDSQSLSDKFYLLKNYKILTILLLMARKSKKIRRQLWNYLTVWSKQQPLLNGSDLKALGYKPGPEFKDILDKLLRATLDGIIKDRTEALNFLKEITTTIST